MAHDDMHVIMYKILAYLYDCMKKGQEPQRSMLAHDGFMLSIPYGYWAKVISELDRHGYVSGFNVTKDIVGGLNVDMRSPEITMEGIEFLQENSSMKKALGFLKEVKSALPFI